MGDTSSNGLPNQTSPVDKGVRSRKFILTIISVAILIGMTILCGLVKALQPMFATFVGGLLGILGLYFGGNVAHRYAAGRSTSMQIGEGPPNYLMTPGYQLPPGQTVPLNTDEDGEGEP